MKAGYGIWLLAGALVAGCIPAQRAPARTAPSLAPPVNFQPRPPLRDSGPDGVIGRDARGVVALFGNPALDVREGPGRKLQFLGASCVLDVYLYPPRNGGEAVATHVDARLPDGRDTDRASCIDSLSRR